MLKRALTVAAICLVLSFAGADGFYARCTGSDPCYACKNCKYCQFCAKQGGKCGVCKRK